LHSNVRVVFGLGGGEEERRQGGSKSAEMLERRVEGGMVWCWGVVGDNKEMGWLCGELGVRWLRTKPLCVGGKRSRDGGVK
jgi:hypothetical protein